MDNQRHPWLLLARKLLGEANEAEETELRKILLRNSELNDIAEMITAFWEMPPETDRTTPEQAFSKLAIQLLQESIGSNKKDEL